MKCGQDTQSWIFIHDSFMVHPWIYQSQKIFHHTYLSNLYFLLLDVEQFLLFFDFLRLSSSGFSAQGRKQGGRILFGFELLFGALHA